MPTFPDDPDDKPDYSKPWRNPAPRPDPPPPLRWDNCRPIRYPGVVRAMFLMTYQGEPPKKGE